MDHAVDYASLILSRFGQFFVDTKRHPRLASYAARHRGCAQIWFHQGTWIACLILVVICAWTYIAGARASNYPIVLLSFATFLALLVGIVGEWALLTSRAVGSYLYMVFYYGSWVAMLWSSAMCYIDAPRVRSLRATAPHRLTVSAPTPPSVCRAGSTFRRTGSFSRTMSSRSRRSWRRSFSSR